MNKIVARSIFLTFIVIVIAIVICAPYILSDENTFLKEFVTHELLNVLGIIFAITLASAANLHLEFNSIEKTAGKDILKGTRTKVKNAINGIILSFSLALLLVFVKPLIPQLETYVAITNGAALIIVIYNILQLTDLTRLVFKIKPI